MTRDSSGEMSGVAIVGMAGRFPGAATVEEFWSNLLAGRESITRFSADALSPLVADELRRHPRYVPVRGVIDCADRFDASFFGIPAREALMMDPQQRIFLELCWNALEHAGVDPERFAGSIGVYAGVSNNGYRKLVESRPDLIRMAGEFAAMLANEKDYVATRVAHRLNLTGPALSIHTACSTSLVAITQAWYALMTWQCDMALAGGINVVVPQESGYVPVEGGMESEDGHCRPFDAKANGTLFSSGGGVVVLKRLSDAVEQGDMIWAVIRGVGINNDGADKASFTAPSTRGQAAVIRQALATAGVEAGSIGYVEAHGTGTQLGDPIEVEALTRAFREDTAENQFCWLGSAKGNLGHLVAGSGVTGLIKAALALHHGCIPPTLHYQTPNPEIDLGNTPFKVADSLIAWPRGTTPRRAGVSSFGVGGTNAHVVLEEAPLVGEHASAPPVTLLTLSARDEQSLRRRASDLAAALGDREDAELADIGYTLAQGRRPMVARGAIVARNIAEAREKLASIAVRVADSSSRLVFLFPGQGSQHANMASALIDTEPVFRDAFDKCCRLASECLGRDLRNLILPGNLRKPADEAALTETRYTQPALFAVEYALAELWESWGYRPVSMIGHSIGEYAAACRAGVFPLEVAVALVVARGAAMFAQPRGSMLAVHAGESEVAQRLPHGVEIAALNAPNLTVVAGTGEAIELFAEALGKDKVETRPLRVSHAFHSSLMDGALPAFRLAFKDLKLAPPQREFYSCVTGAPITAEQATSPDYWCRQLRSPVRFADAVEHVLSAGPTLFVEVGPGQVLTALTRGQLEGRGRAVASLNSPGRPGEESEQLLRALGECWSLGAEPDWTKFYAGSGRRRRPLPGYPFQGERYWIDPPPQAVVLSPVAGERTIPVASTQPLIATPAAAPPASRTQALSGELRHLFGGLTGERIEPAQDKASFLDLGLDSLSLTQAALEIERRYGVKLKFRRLMEDLDSIEKLAAQIASILPAEVAAEPPSLSPAATLPNQIVMGSAAGTISNSEIAQLIQSQIALMNQQTQLLQALIGVSAPAAPVASVIPPFHPAPVADLQPVRAVSIGLARADSANLPVEVPLTEGQMEKWLACQYGGDASIAFNEAFILKFEGPLRQQVLQRAIAAVSLRHEAFALSFLPDGSGQRLNARQGLQVPIVDLEGVDSEARVVAYCAAAARRPFDLAVAPLVRVELLRLGPERNVMLIVAHHLVFDGWSAAVFLDEIAHFYQGFVAGHETELEPAESYRAYALAERERSSGREVAGQIDYWKRIYSVLPDPLRLPRDHPMPSGQDLEAATVHHEFPEDLIAALRLKARQSGITFYSLLLASFGALVSRLSGQSDFVVGIPFAAKSLNGANNLIGDGVNTLPLRLAVEADMPFGELAGATHRALLDAVENGNVTLNTVLRELKLRDSRRRPLAELVFDLNPRVPELDFQGLRTSVQDCPKSALAWELFFNFNESGAGLVLDLHYRSRLFNVSTIQRWTSHYETLLRAVAAGGAGSVGTLPLLDEGTRRMVLYDWNATARSYDRRQSTSSLISAQSARTPRRIAVECGDRSLTYAELDRSSDALARCLRARRVGSGDIVGVYLPRRVEMVVALLGVMKSGAAYLPLDPSFPVERLRSMAEHAGVRQLLAWTQDTVPSSLLQGRDVFPLAELDHIAAPEILLPAVSGDDLAYVLYTSGSTGEPKGVRILHRNLVNFLNSMRDKPGIAVDDVLCAVTTLSFDIAGLELYLPLTVGARITIATETDQRDPGALASLIQRRGATILQTTPSLLRMLVEGHIESVRGLKLLVGGEALPRDLADLVLPCCRELWNMFGPTETTVWSTTCKVTPTEGALPLGKPIDNTRIYVLEANGQPVPPGVIGEIWIAGDGVADGYLNRPDLTAQRFLADPFVDDGSHMYRTGDLGSMRHGILYFHGRADDQIKVRGYRIEPGAIEAVAASDPSVREAVVVAREFAPGDVRLVLFAVLRASGSVQVGALRSRLQEQLPPYMVPQYIEILEALPRTPNGKIDRKALPPLGKVPEKNDRARAPEPVTPVRVTKFAEDRATGMTPTARQLCVIWQKILNVKEVALDDNFFDLGGHSLLAVRVTGEIEKVFGQKMPLASFFQMPTIRHLAQLLSANANVIPWSSLVAIRKRGSRPPFFWAHGEASDAFLTSYLDADQPLYGLRHQSDDGQPARFKGVEEIAAHYLSEIRSVQPHGPYFVGGYCFGALVAFEMAQQLKSQNEEVGLLVLLAPAVPKNLQSSTPVRVNDERVRDEVSRHMRTLAVLRGSERRAYLTRRSVAQLTELTLPARNFLRRAAEKVAWTTYLKLGYPLPVSLRSPYILDVYSKARDRYIAKPYDGGTVLIRGQASNVDCSADWTTLLPYDLSVYDIPGDHTALIRDPELLRAWAEQLDALLAAAREREMVFAK